MPRALSASNLFRGLLGADPGTITINDNAVSSPQIVSLSGSTAAPLVLSPGSITFTALAVGATSPSQTLTLTNHGSTQSLSTIATSGDFLQSNNCPALLASGASCTVNVAFHPTAARVIVGALSVAGSTYGVSAQLSGTGTGTVASHVSLQPASLNFGAKGALDLSTVSKTVTLVNTSSTLSLSIPLESKCPSSLHVDTITAVHFASMTFNSTLVQTVVDGRLRLSSAHGQKKSTPTRSIPPPHTRSEPAANGEVKSSVNTLLPVRLLST